MRERETQSCSLLRNYNQYINIYIYTHYTGSKHANFLKKIVLRDLGKLEENQKKIHFNLTKCDIDIIYNLAQDVSLIFKEADNDGVLVFINRINYLQEINR